jgi:tetratricopeptide (TPR) repeat protein
MKKIIILLLGILLPNLSFSQENQMLVDDNRQIVFKYLDETNQIPGWEMKIKAEVVSVPFEGFTNYDPLNRYDTVMYGCLQLRRYDASPTLPDTFRIAPICYMFDNYNTLITTNEIHLSQTSAITNSTNNQTVGLLCGFSKYKITCTIPVTNEMYVFYFDYSDTKYGKEYFLPSNPPNTPDNHYISRWGFQYNPNRPANQRMELWKVIGYPDPNGELQYEFDHFEEAFTTSDVKDYKIWELATRGTSYHRTTPYEQKFLIRCTPFPLSRAVIEDTLREVSLTVPAKIDTCLQYQYKRNINTNMTYYNFYDGNTVVTPGKFATVGNNIGMRLNLDGGSALTIGNNKRFIVLNYDTLYARPNSTINLNAGAKLNADNNPSLEGSLENIQVPPGINTHGSIILDGATINGAAGASMTIPYNALLEIRGNVTINNTTLNIQNGAKFKMLDNATLTITGSNSYVSISNGANFTLGNGSTININNRANITAHSINFSPSSSWNGITFNDGSSNFINCQFSKAQNLLRYYNTTVGATVPKGIRNCTFTVPANGQGIYAENIYRFIVDGNTFNLSSGAWGLFTRNYISDNPEGGESAPIYDLKVINNTFSNGLYQAFLWAGTSSYLPYYVYNNTFNGNCTYNLAGRRIGGDIKNNKINGNSTGIGVALWEANPNMHSNIFSTTGNTIVLNSAYPNLAPVRNSNNQLVWYGGKNSLTSSQNDNIYISLGYPITNLGLNSFTIQNASKYHIEGYLPDSVQQYYWCLNNCWVGNGTIPKTNLRRVNSGTIVPPNYTTLSCRFDHITLNEDIDSLGDSIYDTVEVTDDLSGTSAGDDEILYSQGQEYEDNANYPEAINQYKTLIDLYPASLYANTALYNLYDCYDALDTSGIEELSDELFGDLRLYLNQKIESDSYSSQFVDAAYNLVLSCEAQMKNLEIALTGYEFIATYHPDPETRLLASMDYSDIEAQMNGGQGGGKSIPENAGDDKKPVLDVVKKAYKEIEKKIESKVERLSKENKTNLTERISSNLQSRGLTQEQKSEQNLKNFTLLSRLSMGKLNQSESDKIIPQKYQLSQNYPNPFNPVTTINYDLPKEGLSKLKVYDITGKEIFTLVNEFKAAGSYQVQFDGTKFSSGVYFYRIEAGSFIETKRMVLVK